MCRKLAIVNSLDNFNGATERMYRSDGFAEHQMQTKVSEHTRYNDVENGTEESDRCKNERFCVV